jgi:hypothetical protein
VKSLPATRRKGPVDEAHERAVWGLTHHLAAIVFTIPLGRNSGRSPKVALLSAKRPKRLSVTD